MRPNNNNNKNTRMKPVNKTLSFVISGKDHYGNEYDSLSAETIVTDLQSCGAFEKLSVMATMSKKIAFNKEDARGSLNVARIQSYDVETGKMDLLFFGKGAEYANIVDNMVVIPHVRLDRDRYTVTTIVGFEIVNAMDA